MSNDIHGGASAWASRQKARAAAAGLMRGGGWVLAAKAAGRGRSWA